MSTERPLPQSQNQQIKLTLSNKLNKLFHVSSSSSNLVEQQQSQNDSRLSPSQIQLSNKTLNSSLSNSSSSINSLSNSNFNLNQLAISAPPNQASPPFFTPSNSSDQLTIHTSPKRQHQKSLDTLPPSTSNNIHNISNSSNNLSRTNSTRSSTISQPRFIIHNDSNNSHAHYLKNIKRQEKLSQMVKDWFNGSKKGRTNDSISAIPNILSSNNLQELEKEAINKINKLNNNKNDNKQPPTLFNSLVNQVQDGQITNFSLDLPSYMVQQPLNPVSISDNDSNVVDNRTFLEKYGRCQEIIGRGTFGIVRISHKKQANGEEKLFAVKEFKKKPNESSSKYSKRLTNEFCISSSLKHLNIIATFDLLKDLKSNYCEVMEYCSGGDLYSLIITAGKLEYIEADCFFKQLIRGVTYMHEMGVAHRDLKPENLLLTSKGILKITDFGNSECFKTAWESDIQLSIGISGSSPYIAPEEYLIDEFDARPVDVWSCGVIYMVMRTGRQLWKLADDREDEFFKNYLLKRKDKKGFEPIEILKRDKCKNVIYSMLDPITERRITSKEILNSEWVRKINCCVDYQLYLNAK